MRDGLPSAIKVFLWALFGGLASGYLAFRLAFILAPHFGDRPERVVLAFILAAATGVAGAVTSGVVAGRRFRSA
ncbi:MAG: hypothetical protein JST54_03385 [Deltaproteobacteria bacterium]|nr:hypothetical protein [Deltaproteobacteria bacterium]